MKNGLPDQTILRTSLFLVLACLLNVSGMTAQSGDFNSLREKHDETPDDPYTFVDTSTMQRQPAYNVNMPDYFTRQVNIDSNGDDIVGDAGNETSIAVDPTNPNRIVIGWRQFDTVTNNFRQAGYGYSLDGGLSWTFPGVINPGVFRSDPVLDFDAQGNFYYNSLQGTFDCDVYQINDGGVVWSGPAPAQGGDKQWMRMDRTSGMGDQHNYSYWNDSFTNCNPNGAFTRSTDGSNTFEDCEPVLGDPIWGTLAVDGNGVLYLVGINFSGFVVTWSTNARDSSANPVTWDGSTQVDLDGSLDAGVPVNPAGLMGQAWIDTDISGGPGDGNIYVLASVERNSVADPADVMFARSTDGGISFEPFIRINTDVGTDAYQWFGTMSVAPNGRIDVVWLDTRDAPAGTNDSVLYYTFSEDQGDTWAPEEPISLPFDPNIGYPNQDKMGDYFDMVSDNDFAHLAWANTINGGQDVYYTRISPLAPLAIDDFSTSGSLINYPNPFSDSTNFDFYLEDPRHVRVEVYDINGRRINTLLDGVVEGRQSISWDGTDSSGHRANSGLYFVSLVTEGQRKMIKVILE